jgi:hypothetical protein
MLAIRVSCRSEGSSYQERIGMAFWLTVFSDLLHSVGVLISTESPKEHVSVIEWKRGNVELISVSHVHVLINLHRYMIRIFILT